MDITLLRNFSIIAHIDHGKSTLADRILEHTGSVPEREMRDQYLDTMDLERERGITIKAKALRLIYRYKDGMDYVLNLIDTPGHVDFSYEVSRSLSACEGVLLVIDGSQGIEAQTVANAHLAMDAGMEIIPVINKIDLSTARPEGVKDDIKNTLGLNHEGALLCSAKDGTGVKEVIDALIERVPHPDGEDLKPLKAMIFDSWYDTFKGVALLVRVIHGRVEVGQEIMLFSNEKRFTITDIGFFNPYQNKVKGLGAGEVGYLMAGIKDVDDVHIGDTITDFRRPTKSPFPGFKVIKPMVFSGLYPLNSGDYNLLRDYLQKLKLNDSSFTFEPESSLALGFGFRCGFLGLLHMDIIRERLEREYEIELLNTAPMALCRVKRIDGRDVEIQNPLNLPPKQEIQDIEEPYVLAAIHLPSEFLGHIIKLCEEVRGVQREIKYLGPQRVMLMYELPLNEIIHNFYDRLKSSSKGYASMDYDFLEYRASDLVRLDLLINGAVVDALSLIVHRQNAYRRGRELASRMKEIIPRQLFEVVVQASIGGKIIAKERIPPFRKDVIAKLYGGDVTRKRKLLERQKAGKKKMKTLHSVKIPQEAFLSILRTESH